MRLTLTVLVLWTAIISIAQSPNPSPAGTIVPLLPRETAWESSNRVVIFQEDFASGIPDNWLNTEAGGIAQWQYRGLNTFPNLEIGTQGTCIPEGMLGQPIQSPSQGNGFVIFDSNWWDNPSLPCTEANMGSGPAPGPHTAILTSPPIDVSNYLGVGLQFHQYYNGYDTHASVEISNDGGANWSEVYSNDLAPNPTENGDFVQIPIGQWVGGLDNVRFRFVFSGLYYFWQIDDVQMVEIPIFDLAIANTQYGDFDINDPAHPTGFEFMEYSRYPYQMAPLLKFSALAVNNGIYENNDVRLNIEISDPTNNIIHTAQSAEGVYVWPMIPEQLRAGTFQTPPTVGEYKVHHYLTYGTSETNTANDHDTTFFQIHDVQFARDRLFATSVYFPSDEFNNVPYEIGNVFLNSADNMTLYSLSVGIGIGTSLPCTVYGALYEIDFTNALEATLIATTSAIDVNNSMLNGFADQIMTTLSFDDPILLENGKAYLAMAGSVEGGNFMVCALSGDAPEYTSWVHFLPDEWRLVSVMPMVRMNFGAFDQIAETGKAPQSILVYPNPSQTTIVIPTERSFENNPIRITDHTGREIMRDVAKFPTTQIDVSHWAKGVYFVHIDRVVTRFVVE